MFTSGNCNMCLWCVFPMHFIGLAGLPRRYYTNTNFPLFDDLQNVNVLITTFALVGGAFQLVFFYTISLVALRKEICYESLEIKYLNGQRLWNIFMVTGLEKLEVHRWPYDYSNLITTRFCSSKCSNETRRRSFTSLKYLRSLYESKGFYVF
jgi:heme/copper-type cytochrome/quinol oxidase subunit 1